MKRIRQLDGVRALAILAVFFNHSIVGAKLLWMGVDIFFVLSGFLITGVLLDAKRHSLAGFFAHFYARRARRILPPYLLLLLLVTLVFGAAWTHYWYFYILLTNFLIPFNIPHPRAFDPLWSLAVEEQFYLAWPFAVYYLSRRRLGQLCVFLMILAPLFRGIFHFPGLEPIHLLTLFRMDLLAAGGLLCLVWRSRKEFIERSGTLCGGILGICGAVGLVGLFVLSHHGFPTYSNSRISNVLKYEFALLISLGVMLYALSGRGVGWLQSRPMTYLGQISYSMYLVHQGILILVGTRFSGILSMFIALSLTIAYAAISWTLLEKPILNAGREKVRHAAGVT